MALQNAYVDDDSHLSNNPEPRVLGAKQLTDKLLKDKKTSAIVGQMQQICLGKIAAPGLTKNSTSFPIYFLAFIRLANKDLKPQLSSTDPVCKLKNLNHVQCPTLPLVISKSCDYSNITSMCFFLL